MSELPSFFRLRQSFPRPRIEDLDQAVCSELQRLCSTASLEGRSVAITAGSRGIADIPEILRCVVAFFHQQRAKPFLVPAMGSHGGGTAEGQLQVLDELGINELSIGCPIHSSMEVIEVCLAAEGFPVYFDRFASQADHVLVVNRLKPHTRFDGAIESGLMKMMLIGLGKKAGAEVYHRAIVNHSFDRIVRSVAGTVVERCNILGGLAILENGYEETAELVSLPCEQIETREPELLQRVKQWMPNLPFDQADLLIVDEIGKNISGTGMDTNVIGRKKNDIAAVDGERPDIHHIYVRGLTSATHGNAAGIGLAAMCHRRVIDEIDLESTRINCITAGHLTGAALPIDFPSDRQALEISCKLAGYLPPREVKAMWIHDTLSLEEVECSEAFYDCAHQDERLELLTAASPLEFDSAGDLIARFNASMAVNLKATRADQAQE